MDDISNPFRMYQTTGGTVSLVNENCYAVSKLHVVRSHPPNPFPTFDVHSPFEPSSGSSMSQGLFRGRETTKPKCLFNRRAMKRRKQNVKYQWYTIEGKVKSSFKKGFRWFKRTCSEIIHGF